MKQSLRVVAVVLLAALSLTAKDKKQELVVTTVSQVITDTAEQGNAMASTWCYGKSSWASCSTTVYPAPTYHDWHFWNVVRGSDGQTYKLHRVRRYIYAGWADLPYGLQLPAVIKNGGMWLRIPLQNGKTIRLGYQIVSQEL